MEKSIGDYTEAERALLEAQGDVNYRAGCVQRYGGWHNEQLLKEAVDRLEKLEAKQAA